MVGCRPRRLWRAQFEGISRPVRPDCVARSPVLGRSRSGRAQSRRGGARPRRSHSPLWTQVPEKRSQRIRSDKRTEVRQRLPPTARGNSRATRPTDGGTRWWKTDFLSKGQIHGPYR